MLFTDRIPPPDRHVVLVLVTWQRIESVRNDSEMRAFADALSRKVKRFAFPDDFNRYVTPLQRRLIERHDKASPEGSALRELAEIRVLAEAQPDAAKVELTFYSVRRDDAPAHFDGVSWERLGRPQDVPLEGHPSDSRSPVTWSSDTPR